MVLDVEGVIIDLTLEKLIGKRSTYKSIFIDTLVV